MEDQTVIDQVQRAAALIEDAKLALHLAQKKLIADWAHECGQPDTPESWAFYIVTSTRESLIDAADYVRRFNQPREGR